MKWFNTLGFHPSMHGFESHRRYQYVPIAQLVEQSAVNRYALGSSPSWDAITKKGGNYMEALLLLGLLLLVLNVVEEDDVVIRNRETKKETNVTSKLKEFINKLKKKL